MTPISIPWPKIYVDLVSGGNTEKSAIMAARQLERDIFLDGWPVGQVFADRPELVRRYGFGRGTLIEAIRLLENRGVARMRRGPGGGLVVMAVPRLQVKQVLIDYFRASRVTPAQLHEARRVFAVTADYVAAVRSGEEALASFFADWRAALQAADVNDPLGKTRSAINDRILSADPFVGLFAETLDDLAELSSASGRAGRGGKHHGQAGRAHKRSLALQIRELLEDEIQRKAILDDRLGTEEEICARLGTSRHVLRQAIRVLENQGVVESQRGRSRGLVAGTPKIAAAVETVIAYLSSAGIRYEDVNPARQIMARLTRVLVMAKATTDQQQEFQRLVHYGHTWRGTGMFNSWIRLDWGIIDNPVLSVMAQALTGYRMRTSNDHCSIPVEGSASIQRTLEEYINAATRRDFSGADDLFENILKKIKGSFSPARQQQPGV